MCKHSVVVFKAQKNHTTLQVKMYLNGCKNAKYEWVLSNVIKCWKYLGKHKFCEAGLVPLTVFKSTRSGYLHEYLCFDWAEKVTGLAVATGRKYLPISPALMALSGRPGCWQLTPSSRPGTLFRRTPASSVHRPPWRAQHRLPRSEF